MSSTLLVLKIWYIYKWSHHTMLIPIRRCVPHTTLCNKVCHWLTTDQWFSPTKKADRHDITEILLKVALTTITQTPTMFNIVHWGLKLNRHHKHQIQVNKYDMLTQGRWFSPGTPASSTFKTGRHDIAEILLKVALKHQKSILKPNRNTITILFLILRIYFSFLHCSGTRRVEHNWPYGLYSSKLGNLFK